jgi:hypothetical protein
VEEADGKVLAGLAVGAVAEVEAGHMPQLAHGGVAVQDGRRKRYDVTAGVRARLRKHRPRSSERRSTKG